LTAYGETERLVFESLRVEHAAGLFPVFCDPLVCQALNVPPPDSIHVFEEDFRRRIAGPIENQSDCLWINFAVRLKSTGSYIGRIEAAVIPDSTHGNWAEIGYVFASTEWGKGYAAESLKWLHQELNEKYRVQEFWATTSAVNERSKNLLLRAEYQPKKLQPDRPLASYSAGDTVLCKAITNRPDQHIG